MTTDRHIFERFVKKHFDRNENLGGYSFHSFPSLWKKEKSKGVASDKTTLCNAPLVCCRELPFLPSGPPPQIQKNQFSDKQGASHNAALSDSFLFSLFIFQHSPTPRNLARGFNCAVRAETKFSQTLVACVFCHLYFQGAKNTSPHICSNFFLPGGARNWRLCKIGHFNRSLCFVVLKLLIGTRSTNTFKEPFSIMACLSPHRICRAIFSDSAIFLFLIQFYSILKLQNAKS